MATDDRNRTKVIKMDRLPSKYVVSKTDGSAVDPDAEYLVLRLNSPNLQEREACLVAAVAYAHEISAWDPQFARQIAARCDIIRANFEPQKPKE